MTQNGERELGWDDRIDTPDEGDFTVFPDGIYPFTILSFERARYEGGDKLPACNMAKINIEFDGGPQLGTNTVIHRLFLHTKTQGMLAQFFRAVGLRKHGDPLVLNWDALAGRRGWAKLSTRTYKGETYQDIKRFIDPEDWPKGARTSTTDVQPVQPAPPMQPAPPAQPADGEIPF